MTFRTIGALAAAGHLPGADLDALEAVTARYAVSVTSAVAALMDLSDPADPIALQYLPQSAELNVQPEELADPIGDAAHSPLPGLVHRYPDRVLLKVIHACPVYCRFCFRREMVGPGGEAMSETEIAAALDYIAAHDAIREVILTGGDPFMLSARRAEALTGRLAAIPSIRVIRWHTRVPFADPARVMKGFARALRAENAVTYVGVHANHPREFTAQARAALAALADAGVVLVSQSVLLRGINDDADVLAALMRCFVENRVKPYYLHHPDLAPGTAHFRMSIAEGQDLMAELRGRISGLAQPQYVLDIPGGHGKSPIGPQYVGAGHALIRDFKGQVHRLGPDQPDASAPRNPLETPTRLA
jgi:lysine 2,3-aminomutase